MKKLSKIAIILLAFSFSIFFVKADEYLYILNDKCINELYSLAKHDFEDSKIHILRDSRGILLRFEINIGANELNFLNYDTLVKLKKIESFLAKIENPAIIEVHTERFQKENDYFLKNWEISTIIANKIEAIITKPYGIINQDRINSVGYGEFLPAKNTSNNGGNFSNRVDIIVLCNVSGE